MNLSKIKSLQLPEFIEKQVVDYIEFLMTKYTLSFEDKSPEEKYPLRGSVISFDNPFSPVDENSWDASK